MTTKATPEEIKAIFDLISVKYFTSEESKALAQRKFDREAVTHSCDGLISEAKALMAKDDPASPQALDLARRWRALVDQFTGGKPSAAAKVRAVWNGAMADPKAAPKLPLNPQVFEFVGKAMAKLKESK